MSDPLTSARQSTPPYPRVRSRLAVWAHVAGALFFVALSSCGGAETKPAVTPGDGHCDGQSRPQLNCESEVAYQGADVKGGFSVLGFGNASGGVEQKALRQIDDQTALYMAESRRLCDEYNKCVIDRDTYSTRTENMRRRAAKVPELLDGLKSAQNDDARRVALGKAYRELVPTESRVELRLDFSALAQRPNEPAMHPVSQGTAIPTGSHVAFMVKVSRPAYVYVFEKSASGSLDILFPDPRITVANPLSAESALRIPQGTVSFKLDDKDIGTEKVYLVASLHPLSQLAAAAAKGPTTDKPSGALNQVSSIDPACKTRGFSLDDAPASGSPGPGCVRSRGLSLDDNNSSGGAEASSLSTTTEAGDDTIATVFSFEHTHK